jgi:hypothetical protein
MPLQPIDLVWARVERSRTDSAIAVFHNLLLVGEALLKTITAGFVAAIQDDKDRHRYRLCHKLVRADALGQWVEVLADLSSGPALQHLMPGAIDAQRELTSRHSRRSYLHDATVLLQKCLQTVIQEPERLPSQFDGRVWYSKFVLFRNKTKGHGAVPDEILSGIVAIWSFRCAFSSPTREY